MDFRARRLPAYGVVLTDLLLYKDTGLAELPLVNSMRS